MNGNAIEKMWRKYESRIEAAPGDKKDESGILVCGKCGKPKQHKVTADVSGKGYESDYFMPIMCECKQRMVDKYEKQKRFEAVEALRRECIQDVGYHDFRFENDDGADSKISEVCRRYVETWEKNKEHGIGILFYGEVRTGKTFMACCIANALIDRMIPAHITNFTTILENLSGFGSKSEYMSYLQDVPLLGIDDLGVERDTPFALEKIQNVVDARSRSRKPIIFTTNLSLEAITSPETLEQKRIYGRVLKMCPITLKMVDQDRNNRIVDDRKELARKILRGEV